LHSIIIPHSDRNAYLDQCLWSITRSAEFTGATHYEVIVVDNGSRIRPQSNEPRVKFVYDDTPMDPFNKPRLQNLGIEAALLVAPDKFHSHTLSFLDADAIVGIHWVCAPALLLDGLTKVCYRVRTLPKEHLGYLQREPDRASLVQRWFDNYSTYTRAFEGYVKPDTNGDTGEPVFGNSQFSIRRSVLGDLRFNEEYKGRGYEDVWMNREIWRHYGEKYKAVLELNPAWALFHIRYSGPEAKGWDAGENNKLNHKRYYAT